MRIGVVCYPTYGGSGVVATELGKALAARGHQIHFISYAMPMRLDGYLDNVFYHEVEMATYPLFEFPLYTPALASKIVEVTRFEKLDLVHAHYAIPHAISGFIAKQILKNDLKIITTLHGTDITLVGLEPSYLSVMKFSIEQSDGVTAVSRFLREKTTTNYGIEKDITVIPNFVDTEKYQRIRCDDIRAKFAPQGEKILVHVSNFRMLKRVPDVIKIFSEVRKKVPSKLILVGDGPDRSASELLTRELALQEHVKFLGKQSELVPLLSSADLMLMPSQSESFGLSALEAMACEVPVISTSVGGLPELPDTRRNRVYCRDRRYRPHGPLCGRITHQHTEARIIQRCSPQPRSEFLWYRKNCEPIRGILRAVPCRVKRRLRKGCRS